MECWDRYDARYYAGCGVSEFGLEMPYTSGPHLQLTEYEVERRTPKGVWLKGLLFRRWVPLVARRRFAHPTKQQALESFCARRAAQQRILHKQLKRAQTEMRAAQRLLAQLQEEQPLLQTH